MTAARALFRCDGVQAPRDLARRTWTDEPPLWSKGTDQNVNLMGVNECASVASELTGHAADLTRIASFVYAADQAIWRGNPHDAHHEAWRRTMALCVPVSYPDFWGQEDVRTALEEALGFATQDRWTFAFSRAADRKREQLPMFDEPGANVGLAHPPDHVLMLSGGADSLCAATLSMAAGRRPFLVWHRPSPAHDGRQRSIGDTLGTRFNMWRSYPGQASRFTS